MILVLRKGITDEEIEQLKEVLRSEGSLIKEIKGGEETILGIVGTVREDLRYFEMLPGVVRAVPISKPYKLVSQELNRVPSVIRVGEVAIGGDRLVVIAGPCAVEERKRTLEMPVGTSMWGRSVSRRRVQTENVAVFLPGFGRRRAQNSWLGPGGNRVGSGNGDDLLPSGGPDDEVCRCSSDRRPQHAEFRAAQMRRPHRKTGAAQTRTRSHHRRVADVRRVHFVGRQ